MKRRVAIIIVCCTFLFDGTVFGCSLAPVFHQVTILRGRVVGKNLGLFQFRWLRESFSVSDAVLTLYEYHETAKFSDLKEIAAVRTDARGQFDFGKLAIGHYILHVASKSSKALDDWFAVEITERVKPTDRILIDISPIHPDCSGGHEFIEKKT